MGRKIYKTANGKDIDLENLIIRNESVRAVGNMNVNARGDVIDNSNTTTSARSAQVNKTYRKQIGNVAQDVPVVSSKKAAKKIAAEANDVIVGLDDVQEPAKKKPTKKKATDKPTGLAAAIAKTQEVNQEPQLTPSDEEKDVTGIKKI